MIQPYAFDNANIDGDKEAVVLPNPPTLINKLSANETNGIKDKLNELVAATSTVGQDNKFKPVYVQLPEALALGDTVATYLNAQLINVSETEIPRFIVFQDVLTPGGIFTTEKHYQFNKLGKGDYGLGGIQIEMSDLILTYENQANPQSIEDLPTTQVIDLGVVTGTLADALVGLDPAITVQEQSIGYRLVKANIGGEDKDFLYTGSGGLSSTLVTTDADFKPFGNGSGISYTSKYLETFPYIDSNSFTIPANLIITSLTLNQVPQDETDFTYTGTTLTYLSRPLGGIDTITVYGIITSGTIITGEETPLLLNFYVNDNMELVVSSNQLDKVDFQLNDNGELIYNT